ncbi:MAG: hypothetical protein PHU14_13135 [Methylovulum sp.]|nr:hypothetical protein [Methylovulum sp.]
MRLVSEGAKFAAKTRRCLGQTQTRQGLGGHLSQANAAVTLPANYGLKGIGGKLNSFTDDEVKRLFPSYKN